MTLIIDSKKGVINTKSTDVSMGKGSVKVGKDLVNEGKMRLYETDLEVAENFIQKGDFRVNDPNLFAKAVLELARSATDAAKFGAEVLKLLSKGE